jgi:NAD-dependent dihydropyrimidine dehydrogenase PreA subunit
MAFKINAACTLCGDCVPVCPTKSIFEGAEHFVIDSDTCEACAVCVPICPEGAIEPEVRKEVHSSD